MAAVATVPQPTLPDHIAPVIEDLGRPAGLATLTAEQNFVLEERVQPGDTLQSLFRRLGIDDAAAQAYIGNDEAGRQALRQLRAGRPVLAMVRPDRSLAFLSLPQLQVDAQYAIERTGDGFRRAEAPAREVVVEMRSGSIESSLFGASDAAGVPDAVTMRLADLFGTYLDFHTDLRKGDRFSVVYETTYVNGRAIQSGRILAAEFVNNGNTYRVALFRDSDGEENYYSTDGRGLKQAFLRSPLEFSRVSSNFGSRFHPILKDWRVHKGTDFAAPRGTAVKATSDGVVETAAFQGAYGNLVVLRHRDQYSTAYAHLERFASGLQKGQRVRQGDIIGYVGSTGRSTGPHLHYEFRVRGEARDFFAMKMPAAAPLDSRELARFRQESAPLFARLDLLAPRQLASNGN